MKSTSDRDSSEIPWNNRWLTAWLPPFGNWFFALATTRTSKDVFLLKIKTSGREFRPNSYEQSPRRPPSYTFIIQNSLASINWHCDDIINGHGIVDRTGRQAGKCFVYPDVRRAIIMNKKLWFLNDVEMVYTTCRKFKWKKAIRLCVHCLRRRASQQKYAWVTDLMHVNMDIHFYVPYSIISFCVCCAVPTCWRGIACLFHDRRHTLTRCLRSPTPFTIQSAVENWSNYCAGASAPTVNGRTHDPRSANLLQISAERTQTRATSVWKH